jgi:uncharacterized protein YlxW (UPF0749 family)
MQRISYEGLLVEYDIIQHTKIKDIVVYISDVIVARGLLEFLELVALMEGFLANQLPHEKEKYEIVIEDKTPYLVLDVAKYQEKVYMDKAEVRVYLKILKQFEKKVDIFVAGEKQSEELMI